MTKAELMDLVGKYVFVEFESGRIICGILRFADEFSEKHDYRKPNYFYVGNTSFKVSHIKKLTVSEVKDE